MKRFAPGMLVTRRNWQTAVTYNVDPTTLLPTSRLSFSRLPPGSVLLVVGSSERPDMVYVLTSVGLRWVYTSQLKLV